MNVGDEGFRADLVEALNRSAEFQRETRWFDGSILLEVDGSQCWLKIYRGKALEALDFTPPLGYTFKISGPGDRWDQFISGERRFADLLTPGSRYFASAEDLRNASGFTPPDIRVEGNTMEANRLHEALYHLGDCIAVAAK